MHIFLCRSSQRQRSVVISLSLIPVVLHSCVKLQSEKHIKPVLFKETPRSQFCVFLGSRKQKMQSTKLMLLLAKLLMLQSLETLDCLKTQFYICFSVFLVNAAIQDRY